MEVNPRALRVKHPGLAARHTDIYSHTWVAISHLQRLWTVEGNWRRPAQTYKHHTERTRGLPTHYLNHRTSCCEETALPTVLPLADFGTPSIFITSLSDLFSFFRLTMVCFMGPWHFCGPLWDSNAPSRINPGSFLSSLLYERIIQQHTAPYI